MAFFNTKKMHQNMHNKSINYAPTALRLSQTLSTKGELGWSREVAFVAISNMKSKLFQSKYLKATNSLPKVAGRSQARAGYVGVMLFVSDSNLPINIRGIC